MVSCLGRYIRYLTALCLLNNMHIVESPEDIIWGNISGKSILVCIRKGRGKFNIIHINILSKPEVEFF